MPILLYAVTFGAVFFIAQHLRNYFGPGHRSILILCLSWMTAGIALEWCGLPRVNISTGLALTQPELLAVSRFIGASGVDALIIAFNYAVVQLCGRSESFRVLVVYLFASTFAFLIPKPMEDVSGGAEVAMIQPSFSSKDYQDAQWSLYIREQMESSIDSFVGLAASQNIPVILVPEGGNGLYNLRLSRRASAFDELLRDSSSHVFMSSMDLDPEGLEYNLVAHYSSVGLIETKEKMHLVPFAEANLTPGQAKTFSVNGVVYGIAICYESFFSVYQRSLVAQGSDVLVVLTNDSSLGDSGLAEWHYASSVYRGIEFGRSVVFLSNNGISALVSRAGYPLYFSRNGTVQSLKTLEVGLSDIRTPYYQLFDLINIGPLFIIGLLLIITGFRKRVYPNNASPILAQCRPLLLSPLIALISMWIWISNPKSEVSSVLDTRLFDRRDKLNSASVDNLSSLYKQSYHSSCGAAALAFSLTLLGDVITEQEVLKLFPANDANGYSLLEMREMATARGFNIVGLKSTSLPKDASPSHPYIVHMNSGHYVVLMSFDDQKSFIFDPAKGISGLVPTLSLWKSASGFYLRIGTRRDVVG